MVKFHTEYYDGDTEWRPINLVFDTQPQMATNYVMQHDLCTTHNTIYRQWTRVFLCSLKRALHRRRQSSILRYSSNLSRGSYKYKKRRYQNATSISTSKNNTTLKHGLEVPKKWVDILWLDKESKNRM